MFEIDTPNATTVEQHLEEYVGTQAAPDDSTACLLEDSEEGWLRTRKCLHSWLANPSQMGDDDLIPPSTDLLRFACEYAAYLRRNQCPPPFRVLPDGYGGIVFERREDDALSVMEISAERVIRLRTFRGGLLISESPELVLS